MKKLAIGCSGWYAAGTADCEMVETVICNQIRVFMLGKFEWGLHFLEHYLCG